MDKEKILDKIESLFKEETWGRIDPKDIGISKFRILEDLLDSILSEGIAAEVTQECRTHIADYPQSITARYLLGIIAYQMNLMDEKVYLKNLTDLFISNHKWAVTEHISQKILEYGENRYALKTLATSLEKLSRSREAIPVWEELLKIDRFDSEVAKKLSFAIIDDDPAKSMYYMKLSLEAFIRNGEFDEAEKIFGKIVTAAWEDLPYFERIERMLTEAKRFDLSADMLRLLLKKYRDADSEQCIFILKKILEYVPDDVHSRNEILKLYRAKFSSHTLLDQFISISKLDNPRSPVLPALKAFENFIIFDNGNFVMHRSWGLGRITSMDSEAMIVDFSQKPGHSMSMQMALTSLTPIGKEHLYARQFEDPASMKKMFAEDICGFFSMLLKSFGGSMSGVQMKKELIPFYLEQGSWSKWWTKSKAELRKNPLFGFDEPKTGDIFLREKPVTYCDVLVDRFRKADSFSDRLDTAIEFVNNIDIAAGAPHAAYFVDFFATSAGLGSKTKLVLSYFALRSFSKFVEEKSLGLAPVRAELEKFIRESSELPMISMKITDYDNKKDFVNLIVELRSDWKQILSQILFETPVRIHRFILSTLIRAHAYSEINTFIERVSAGSKQSPEIMLWIAKNIFSGEWDYEWLDYSKPRLIISLFRMINELKRIETKGNRLKNMAVELLIESDGRVMEEIIAQSELALIGKAFDVAKSSEIIEDSYLDRMLIMIRKKYPDFKPAEAAKIADEVDYEEEILVTQAGFDRKSAELAMMVNNEMARLSRDLSAASDVSSDVRENVDYNALMEKQGILKQAISRLDSEIKKAKIIDFNAVTIDAVSVGTRVTLESPSGEKRVYCVLGPWDADFERGILSYRSPIVRALLKKKAGEEVKLQDASTYRIVLIEKAQ